MWEGRMCDMQKMPASDDAPCEEDSDMNFAAFSALSGAGTHFVTTNGQIPVTKIQQNASNNGTMPQIVSMVGNLGDGLQYVRHMDGSMTTPQLISVPIALPNAKPGDPQPTVQIQVLGPNLLQQQQPKYQMQIPIQGFQQGGAVLTLAYSPENGDNGGIQLLGNGLPEGLQVLASLPQEMQLMQPSQAHTMQDNKDQVQHQVFITQNQQILINSNGQDNKMMLNNNNNETEDINDIVIKEECDENNCDDESSQGTEASDTTSWQISAAGHQDLVKYLNQLPPQQTQALPASLQQFLRLNPADAKKEIEIEMPNADITEDKSEPVAVAVIEEDGVVRIQCKKKKKYKKKPPKPARPKPGQVVIVTAADGTLIYCCPECEMAYPDKDQLENHLPAHKIERRFICGICGAGLKRKEHLERHKLGHNPERPYVCGVCRKGFKRREHLNLHTVIHSGVKTEMCQECGKGFYRKDHLRKHTRSHESKRAREEANFELGDRRSFDVNTTAAMSTSTESVVTENVTNNSIPEITIHVPMECLKVPTSGHSRVPVHINIPAHMVSSLSTPLNDAIDSIMPTSS